MFDLDLFEFYRFMLATVVAIYSLIKLTLFIWRWQGVQGEARIGSRLAYQYLLVLLLGVRVRRFLYEFIVMGGLIAILILLIRAHG